MTFRRGLFAAVSILILSAVPESASAFCLYDCPPSDSEVLAFVQSKPLGTMGGLFRFTSYTLVDSQDSTVNGIQRHVVFLNATAASEAGQVIPRLFPLQVVYEKRNSGWVMLGIKVQ